MVRFAVLCIVLLSSSLVQVVQSAYLLSQVCKSDAEWKHCNPEQQKAIKGALEGCRKHVLEDAQISTGGDRRRLGEQQHEQRRLQVSCPEPLSCSKHDTAKMCFQEHSTLGCDKHFGGMEMSGKELGLANALSKCTKDAIERVEKEIGQGTKCAAEAAKILGGCEQIAYLYL